MTGRSRKRPNILLISLVVVGQSSINWFWTTSARKPSKKSNIEYGRISICGSLELELGLHRTIIVTVCKQNTKSSQSNGNYIMEHAIIIVILPSLNSCYIKPSLITTSQLLTNNHHKIFQI